MKKILFLLLSTIAMYGQVPADATPLENIQITNNTQSTTATKVNVQENDGTINTISKSDLVTVVEVHDVPSLPLVGEVGKIYVVKNVNKIYRWNGTFYQELAGSDISGLQAQIDLKANNSDVVKLTGNQSITGQKTFNNSSTGFGIRSDNSSTGFGIVSTNSSTGSGIFSTNSSTGDGIVSRQTGTATGFNYVGQNNETNTFTVNKLGVTTATSFINSTAPANNILLAGGGDLAQGTAFNKNFGTTAGTVVEGGTLGSNAYSSTAYLPLSGGTLSGALNGTSGGFSSSVTATSLIKSSAPATNILLAGGTDITQASLPVSTATQTALNLKANLASPTFTGTPTAPTAPAGTNTTQIATTAFVNGGLATKENAFTKNTAFNKNFGTTAGTVVEGGTLGSNAYSSTAFAPLNGTGANGTWGINISGSASSATNWGGISANFVNWEDTPQYLLGVSAGVAHYYNQQYVRNFLGLGSNAYTSTAYLPLSGGTLSGAISGTSATFSSSVEATQYKIYDLNTAPTSATAIGATGEIRITAGFIYVCTATNTWVRTALATW